jgi:hypothetical protein
MRHRRGERETKQDDKTKTTRWARRTGRGASHVNNIATTPW